MSRCQACRCERSRIKSVMSPTWAIKYSEAKSHRTLVFMSRCQACHCERGRIKSVMSHLAVEVKGYKMLLPNARP